MNSQQNFLNIQFDDGYIFPPNVEFAAEQQTQQQNMQYQVNNQIYPPQVEHQTIEQVYQPNIEYPVNQETNQSNTEYLAANDQFYQYNADFNMERKPSSSLPQKEKRRRSRITYSDEQLNYLEEHFKKNQYITLKKKKELAETLGIEEKQIKKWYQNRRMKENAKRKADWREANENQPNQSIENVRGNDYRINLNPMNVFQYNAVYPEATSREVLLNVNRTQYLGEPKENNYNIGEPQNFNNYYYAYNDPNIYGNNLIQNPGAVLHPPLENFHPAPLQQNYQNIFNNYYYGNNRNENLIENPGLIPYPPLQNNNPLQFQEDNQNIFQDNFLPYNEHEQN